MKRSDIIRTIGIDYLVSNIENDEYSYWKAYKVANLYFEGITDETGRTYKNVDIRFVIGNISILVETKPNFNKKLEAAKRQLSAYVEYEKKLTGNKIVSILIDTVSDDMLAWRGAVSDANLMGNEKGVRTAEEYVDFYSSKINDKEKIMQNTYRLNELLHKHGISEKLRSQFVGTCLLALKNGLVYDSPLITADMHRAKIRQVLAELLSRDLNKAAKLVLLDKNILDSQDVRLLKDSDFREILKIIDKEILPYINDKSTAGQDLLNLFFITFNKYVGKTDKNQAFTPDHITDFMAKVAKVNKNSIVLDPCCGSGSFLVRAMTMALDDCATAAEQELVKKNQIFGIEFDENVFGLATTNMLIHGDGNSNIYQGSCFDNKDKIQKAKPTVVLMNPPYNAQRKHMPEEYTKTWKADKKEDPSKGFYFVKYILDTLNESHIQATVAVLLPVACAIGTGKVIAGIKEKILKESTLDAVFTLPQEVFYPGASASVCCMVFKTCQKHENAGDTFFGYYKEDGFHKKKNIGRVETTDSETGVSTWIGIEEKWLELYKNRREVDGMSAVHKVDGSDEWLCEAYMKTDYSLLTEADFQRTINYYLSFLVKEGVIYED